MITREFMRQLVAQGDGRVMADLEILCALLDFLLCQLNSFSRLRALLIWQACSMASHGLIPHLHHIQHCCSHRCNAWSVLNAGSAVKQSQLFQLHYAEQCCHWLCRDAACSAAEFCPVQQASIADWVIGLVCREIEVFDTTT